jgi:hypothetical protein
MTRQVLHALSMLTVGAFITAAPAAAQVPQAAETQASGWTFTPALLAGTVWDDNALIRNEGPDAPGDVVNRIGPRVALDFKGRRGDFGANYDGAFQMYRALDTLNSYDQQASVAGRRLLSPHVTLTTGYQLSAAPTTELIQLAGIPFVRSGSTNQNLRGGVEARLSKRTSLSAHYNFQVVDFTHGQGQAASTSLLGGHSHAASVDVQHAFSARTSLTGNYSLQRAAVGTVAEAFEVHGAEGGIEYRWSPQMKMFATGGFSHLAVSTVGASRTGPSWHAGLTREFEAGTVTAAYSRSFVPSYGFGGTQQNEEISATARVPLSRMLYSQSTFAWRRNEPLTTGGLTLRTLTVQASLGYLFAPWAGVEGFYDSASQTIERPGGIVNRHRIGVQIITTKPMRFR